ncbi:MAG: TonB-dependent receptor plug domain-containing protein, partial [Flavisolibacter sp.]|nr:TonB-dependent receptor plug domain-containing protein [Flavisolibacter sp.]
MRSIILIGSLLLGTSIARAQSITVKGVVIEASDKKPISGVTITSNIARTELQTNAVGEFQITTSENDTLIISHVNYQTQRVAVRENSGSLLISLARINDQMEEVTINTGYQRLKPNEVNGSFSVVTNEKLNEQKGTSVLDRLNGVTPGVLFKTGKNSSSYNTPSIISIRGESTINGPLDPLIILDNFPYDGDINNINPNDVETITVLKDAVATSIYGAKGGNGVVVITTKRGKYNSKTRVDVSFNTILTKGPDLFQYQQLNSADFIEMEQFLFNKGYYNNTINSPFKQAISPAVAVLLKRKKGQISASDSASQINYLKSGDSKAAYNSLYANNSMVLQNNISIRGGSENIAWVLGGNYDQSDNYDRSKTTRGNIRFNNTFRIGKRISLDAGLSYANSTAQAGAPSYNSVR